MTPLRKTAICSALLASMLAACHRDPAPAADASADALRQGIVTVSAEEASGHELNWTPPVAAAEGMAVEEMLRRARRQLQAGHLYQDGDAALPWLFAALRHEPDNRDALALRSEIITVLIHRGDDALAQTAADWPGALALSHQLAAVLRVVDAADPRVQAFLSRLDASDRLDALLELGHRDLAEGRLGEAGIGARVDFSEVLRNRPEDVRAWQGLMATQAAMLERAASAAEVRDYINVLKWMRAADEVDADPAMVIAQWQRIEALRLRQVQELHAQARILLQDPHVRGALPAATALLRELERVAVPNDGLLADLRERIPRAQRYGAFAPGQRLREALRAGGNAPLLVVVPQGSFTMGAEEGEQGASKAEYPAHPIELRRGFALGVTEVTVGEFAAFVANTGWQTRAERRGHSTIYDARSGNFTRRSGVTWRDDYTGRPAAPDLPVIHVDMRDADAYTAWLSAQTGRRYRSPTETEFEYALRVGKQGRFPWGNGAPPPGAGNVTGSLDVSPTGRRWANAFAGYGDGYWGPAPVGRDVANAFGLHDMAGNVSEWVADCWHQGYRRAPADGAAWFNPGCRSRVVRGGSWAGAPDQVRSAWRMAQAHDTTNARTGFRVARDL